jgi:hypothetical protein
MWVDSAPEPHQYSDLKSLWLRIVFLLSGFHGNLMVPFKTLFNGTGMAAHFPIFKQTRLFSTLWQLLTAFEQETTVHWRSVYEELSWVSPKETAILRVITDSQSCLAVSAGDWFLDPRVEGGLGKHFALHSLQVSKSVLFFQYAELILYLFVINPWVDDYMKSITFLKN